VRHDAEGRAYYCAPRGDYTDESIAKLDSEGRVHRTASGRVYVKYFLERDEGGRWARRRRIDALWTDVAPLRHAPSGERTGYPTQKPRALLDRIVEAATERGDVVLDVFGGSGTSAESAVALGRYALYADKSPVALATAKARLLRANAPYVVLRTAHQAFPAAVTPKVRVHSYGAGCQVELREPAEPLAWMVGRLCDGTFRVAAHSVRHLGARAAPVSPSLAVSPRSVEAATKGGAGGRARENLHVRIVMDDGSEGEVKA
jgi:site-specific DNA-methyltransferase (adenine-specific)/adenine-specific DNA-methyltransferase